MTSLGVAHPLDFASLVKGSVIPQSQIERIFSDKLKAGGKYHLLQLALQQQIERERPDLYSRCSRGDILVMSDEEAEPYNRKRHGEHVAGLLRDSARRARIDRTTFDDAHRRASESLDRSYQGVALMAVSQLRKAERKAALLEAPERAKELAEEGTDENA